MKIKPLCLTMLMLGLSSTSVLAADGTLTFKGKIGTASCQVTEQGGEIIVNMGTVPVTTLQKDPDGPAVGFTINLMNCDSGTYYLVLDGKSPVNQENVLELDDQYADSAKGVGIKVADINDNTITLSKPFDEEKDASVTIDQNNGSGTFNLKAHYYAYDPANLSSGVANATATFTIVQK